MNNKKCSCGGNIEAVLLFQKTKDYYVKKDGSLYSSSFRKTRLTYDQMFYVCDKCNKQKSDVFDFD